MPVTVAAVINATATGGPTSRNSNGVGAAQWEADFLYLVSVTGALEIHSKVQSVT